MKLYFPWALLFLLATGCSHDPAPSLQGTIVDLSHPFDAQTIYWPTEEGFFLKKEFEGLSEGGYFYSANQFIAAEHGGTHLDAPIHFHRNGRTVEQIPVSQTVGPGVLVDVSKQALGNPDYLVSTEDLLEWEKGHGRIPQGAILLLRTGYGKFWPDRKNYLGTEEQGKGAIPHLHFPGVHPGAARWLAENRKVKALGIDTASIDFGQSESFHSHQILAAQNILILENVAALEKLPEKGFTIIALPMKIAGGSGAPTRIIAIVPEKGSGK